MFQVMKGERVLELAQFTFVPSAGGLPTDWGADVIEIEHPVRGVREAWWAIHFWAVSNRPTAALSF